MFKTLLRHQALARLRLRRRNPQRWLWNPKTRQGSQAFGFHRQLAVAVLAVLPAAGGCTAAQPTDSGNASAGDSEPVVHTAAEPPPAPDDDAATDGGTVSASDAEPAVRAADLTCEVYCSETKLRTVNAKLSWIGPSVAPEARPGDELAGGTEPVAEQLQTTVYKGGFDKDLYASFLLSGEAAEPRPASDLPAYDLEVLGVERPPELRPSGTDDEPARTTVEIEGLEPGMSYTWRVVIETAGGQEITETVTCEAPTCTADDAGGIPH